MSLFPGKNIAARPSSLKMSVKKENIAAFISKQGMLEPSSHYSHPGWWALRGLSMEKSRTLPQIAEVHIKGMTSVSPDLCIFPYMFVSKLCPTLCNPMKCSPPGFSVHGISQARILEWVVIFFSRRSFWPRDQIHMSCIGRRILYCWATRKEFLKKSGFNNHLLKFWLPGLCCPKAYMSQLLPHLFGAISQSYLTCRVLACAFHQPNKT